MGNHCIQLLCLLIDYVLTVPPESFHSSLLCSIVCIGKREVGLLWGPTWHLYQNGHPIKKNEHWKTTMRVSTSRRWPQASIPIIKLAPGIYKPECFIPLLQYLTCVIYILIIMNKEICISKDCYSFHIASKALTCTLFLQWSFPKTEGLNFYQLHPRNQVASIFNKNNSQ